MQSKIKILQERHPASDRSGSKTLYDGPCTLLVKGSVREIADGAENNSDVIVRINKVLSNLRCGDSCNVQGILKPLAVRKFSFIEGASADFTHTKLVLR